MIQRWPRDTLGQGYVRANKSSLIAVRAADTKSATARPLLRSSKQIRSHGQAGCRHKAPSRKAVFPCAFIRLGSNPSHRGSEARSHPLRTTYDEDLGSTGSPMGFFLFCTKTWHWFLHWGCQARPGLPGRSKAMGFHFKRRLDWGVKGPRAMSVGLGGWE